MHRKLKTLRFWSREYQIIIFHEYIYQRNVKTRLYILAMRLRNFVKKKDFNIKEYGLNGAHMDLIRMEYCNMKNIIQMPLKKHMGE